MEFFMDVSQLFVCDVRVNLCGLDVGVAEHGLDASDVGAVF